MQTHNVLVLIRGLAMQIDQERLKNENTNLVAAFREKSRKHQQTQELYDRLKRKEMTAATQSAAYQSVDEVLGSVANSGMSQYPNVGRAQGHGQQFLHHDNLNPTEQGYGRDRDNSNVSNGNSKDTMMPPPPRRPGGFGVPVLGSCPAVPGSPASPHSPGPNRPALQPRQPHRFP